MLVKMFRVRKCQKFKDDVYLTFEELAKELKELPDYKLGDIILDLFDGKSNKIQGDNCWYELGDYQVNVPEEREGFKRRLEVSNGNREEVAKTFDEASRMLKLKDVEFEGSKFNIHSNRFILFDKNGKEINEYQLHDMDDYLDLEVLETKESGYQDMTYFVGFKTLHIKLNIDGAKEDILSPWNHKFGETIYG